MPLIDCAKAAQGSKCEALDNLSRNSFKLINAGMVNVHMLNGRVNITVDGRNVFSIIGEHVEVSAHSGKPA